uniref:FMRFamide-like neuropeptide FLP7 n=1 Tax=Macrobrachium rosenbergii TaxID=79674 RepID=FAR7_MACRS|nr:RecName: Full=FMRFamide-like neuropeptide FLP7; AltName: Full=GYGDRNFLRF-amide [Macrobrachium rosenbergii]
GYGDRNFLRF